jgi:glycosidase
MPTIFYGDEAGLEGYRDPFNRMPFPWGKEDMRLVEYYRLIGKIRRENDIYKSGDFMIDHLDDKLLVFRRYDETQAYITVINNSDSDKEAIFDTPCDELISGKSESSFVVKAYGAAIFKATRGATLEI